MKLSALKKVLPTLNSLTFVLPSGEPVQSHFHITEVGKRTKDFIDCGGTVRQTSFISLQLWLAEDVDHRLLPNKLLTIIELSEKTLNLADLPVEIEYQTETIGRYGVVFIEGKFMLINTKTDCLAPDKCMVPPAKEEPGCCSGSRCC